MGDWVGAARVYSPGGTPAVPLLKEQGVILEGRGATLSGTNDLYYSTRLRLKADEWDAKSS
jgi:hypothetical protein